MNQVKKIFLGLMVILCLALFGSSMAHAADKVGETPDALIQRISQEVLETAKKDKDIQSGNEQKIRGLVESKILPHIDFQLMTKMAMANNWKNATPKQQQELVQQFSNLLIYTYSNALSQVKDQTLEYKTPLYDGDSDVVVRSQVLSSRGEPIQLNYHLTKEAGSWKIYDINVLGAWLIETYKGSFRAEVNKSGIDGLIEVLSAKNKKLATSFSKKPS